MISSTKTRSISQQYTRTDSDVKNYLECDVKIVSTDIDLCLEMFGCRQEIITKEKVYTGVLRLQINSPEDVSKRCLLEALQCGQVQYSNLRFV